MAHALIFDSGVGGLSVVSEIRKRLPKLHLSYVADDAFRPYGTKTETALRARLPGLLKTLENMLAPDLIVIACNTASVTALTEIRAAVSVPVVGVVPAIKPAASESVSKSIAVLGTPGTVKREYVDSLIDTFASDCSVTLKGSSALVELAERRLAGEDISAEAVCDEVTSIFKKAPDIDAVVLACTHFPLLKDMLSPCGPSHVKWIDSGAAIARRVETVLNGEAVLNAVKSEITDFDETAFLIGPDALTKRSATFHKFGFSRVVGLCPQ